MKAQTLSLFFLIFAGSARAIADPPPAATASFNTYIALLESHLAQQHASSSNFLPLAPGSQGRLRQGELIIEPLAGAPVPDALLHHWRGTAFAPGATVASFEVLMHDFKSYPQVYAPQVLQARVLATNHAVDELQATMRVRQRHVITVVLDTTYDIIFRRLDPRHAYMLSRSTRIAEPDNAEDHGFLWRQNTYWTCEERDGGLYLQVESVSLSRSIPRGLAWAVQPFVESVPRESLEFTLHATVNALRK